MSKPIDKPLMALTQFGAALGWQDLRINQHRWLDGETLVITTWYESGIAEGRRSDVFLQIDEAPMGKQ